MSHLTTADRAALEAYIRACAIRMDLGEWDIDLDREVPDMDDALALCTCIYGRRAATISVHAGFRRDAPERQRAIITHELLHCHFEHCAEIVREDVRASSMRSEEADLLDAAFTRAFEYGIDATAQAWARSFPVIQWPKPPAAPTAKSRRKPAKKPKRTPA